MQYILCFIFIITSFACRQGTSTFRHANKLDPSAQKLASAEDLHDIGDHHAAIAQLRLLIDTATYSPIVDRAYLLMVEWLIEIRREQEARRLASQFLMKHKDSPTCDKIIALFERKPESINAPLVSEMSEEPRELAADNENLFFDFNNLGGNRPNEELLKK